MNTPPLAQSDFSSLGIAPKILDILAKLKFEKPTPIQAKTIPVAITGKDLMGIAQTGTGKTLAFGIPMIQRLAQDTTKTGLIVLPTRELAIQVNDALKRIGAPLGLKAAILIGGEPASRQIRMLRDRPQIVIATPGRLIDMLDSKHIKLNNVGILVLDEADRMLDMGFAPQIKKILVQVPKVRQTMLFSATMPDAIMSIANSHMSLPLRVEVAPAGTATKLVTQEVFMVHRADKPQLLASILKQYTGSVLIFSRTKHGAKKIAHMVRNLSVSSSEIHSNRSLNQRLEALQGFKVGKYRVLVATDIAARGIDVTGIQLVINYDLPDNPEDYVHRIGRTGRAGSTGHAISFAMPEQARDIKTIERLIKKTLPVSKTPELPRVAMPHSTTSERPSRPYSHGRPSSSRPNHYSSRSGPRHGYRGKPTNSPRGRSSSFSKSRTSTPRKDVWPRYRPAK